MAEAAGQISRQQQNAIGLLALNHALGFGEVAGHGFNLHIRAVGYPADNRRGHCALLFIDNNNRQGLRLLRLIGGRIEKAVHEDRQNQSGQQG